MITISQELRGVRTEVMNAFNKDNGYFYHQKPYMYDNFIDGMAWVGLLVGACCKVEDTELQAIAERYVQTIIDVAVDARNFAPIQVKDSWKKSENIPGLWYAEKAQSSAGPLALIYALKCGSKLKVPKYLKEKGESSIGLTKYGFLFGLAVNRVSSLRQHINTMFMAHLAKGKKPSSSLRKIAEENPFYSYICGKKCKAEYPGNAKLINITSEESKKIVEFKYAKPTSWVFRRDPWVKYQGEPSDTIYTPIDKLVAEYLQLTL